MENKDRMLGEGIARQELHLMFVIDNSGSMEGEKLGAVNNAIRDVMSIMPEIQEDTADATIKISALKFSDDAKWVYSTPQVVSEFKWKDLSTEGGTNLSAAYDELSKWLCKKEKGGQMPDIGGVAPILILMTDGMPTSFDWEQHLDSLKKKGWFKVALKYALAIGIDTQEAMDVLSKFTGNPETVLKVYTAEALRKVIKVIAVTASKVKSNSASMGFGGTMGATNNEIAKNEIAEKLEDIQDVEW
ncbi:MAG: VWA domain-containing protein [Clostridia bacterium]|nr:VWA domain-containing protein [Clostridia bacterium]